MVGAMTLACMLRLKVWAALYYEFRTSWAAIANLLIVSSEGVGTRLREDISIS